MNTGILVTTYNKEGLQYDPTKDYRPRPPKIKVKQDLCRKVSPTLPTEGAYLDQPAEIVVKQNISRPEKDVSNSESVHTADATLESEQRVDGAISLSQKSQSSSLACDANSNFEPAKVQKAICFAEEQVSSTSDAHFGSRWVGLLL